MISLLVYLIFFFIVLGIVLYIVQAIPFPQPWIKAVVLGLIALIAVLAFFECIVPQIHLPGPVVHTTVVDRPSIR